MTYSRLATRCFHIHCNLQRQQRYILQYRIKRRFTSTATRRMKVLLLLLTCIVSNTTFAFRSHLITNNHQSSTSFIHQNERLKTIVVVRRYRSINSFLNMFKQGLEAILWDMDGVLADTERDGHRPAFNKAFEESNLNTVWDVDRYGKLLEIGGGKERMTAHWNEVGWPDAIPTDQQADMVLKLHLRKTDIFMDMINEGTIPLRPGVLRLIDDAIAANIRLAVCSTSNVLAVTNLVNTLMGPDRAKHFQIFAGDMVKRKKPAPDVYNMAVEEMGLDKSKCVIVEDSHIGLGAAKAAGIACIVTKSYYTANEDFTGASMIVDELGDDPTTCVTLETLTTLLR